MSTYLKLMERGDAISVCAVPNGRVRYGVYAYLTSDLTTPIVTMDANLNNEEDRDRLVAKLPALAQEEAPPMLRRLAASVAAARLPDRSAGRTATEEQGRVDEEPWPEHVDGNDLLHQITALISSYMVLPEHADVAIALWLVHTYALDASFFTPYIWITSPTRECGKSTLLELLEHLAFRAMLSGSITPAALYRTVERDRPTLLLDELDAKMNTDSGESLRGVLNDGFKRTGKFTICVGDAHEPQDFSTFCPKVLAGIGRLWETVTSRSIPIRLQRAQKDQLRGIQKIRGHRIDGICQPYRRQLLTLAAQILDEIVDAEPALPDSLGARQNDIWRPLFAIADAVGGTWPERARSAACALHGTTTTESDVGLLMLEDIRQLFVEHGIGGQLSSEKIVEELAKREDRPWSEWRRGQPISKNAIAKLLDRFDISPKQLGVGVWGKNPRGYDIAQFRSAFAAYLPASGPPIGETATSAASATAPSPSVVEAPVALVALGADMAGARADDVELVIR